MTHEINPRLDKAIATAADLAGQLNTTGTASCTSAGRCAKLNRVHGRGRRLAQLCTACQAHYHACETERLLRHVLCEERERATEEAAAGAYVVATLSEARALRPGQPFRAPHYTCPPRALREEVMLAQGGVLYFDQLADWYRGVLAEVADARVLDVLVVVAPAEDGEDTDRWNRHAAALAGALTRRSECFAKGCGAAATTGERAPLPRGRGETVYHWCPVHAPEPAEPDLPIAPLGDEAAQ